MSVIAQVVVESRRYSGWVDPRYPIGYWQAALIATGDATGGVLGIDLVFQPGTTPFLNSQMYSVERIAILTADAFDRVIRVAAINMAGPDNLGFNQQYSVFVGGQTAGNQGGISGNQLTFLPWFLGSQRTPSITASLSIVAPNVDGILIEFEAEGYRWSPRSVLVDGGPQRPPTGLYRA